MAGSWIKMRTNLDTDPRVLAIVAATGANKHHVKGALHWLWSQGDEHSTDGKLWGYTPEIVDAAAEIKGFSAALQSLKRDGRPRPWLVVGDGFVQIPRFDDHNGESAKARANGAVRASRFRNKHGVTDGVTRSVTRPLRNAHLEQSRTEQSNSRAEKRREESEQQSSKAAAAPDSQTAFRSAAAASPQDPQSLCRGIWRDQVKADRIAMLDGATTERILWLIWRTRTEKPPPSRPQGFIEKGIRGQWVVDPEWLRRYEAERARLNGVHA